MKKPSILNLFPNHSDAAITPIHDSELPLLGALTRRELLFVAGGASLTALAGMKSQAQSGSGRRTLGKGSGRIDVHHHFIPPQYLKDGPPSVAMSKVEEWSPAHAIEDMDRTGVAISVLSFASPYLVSWSRQWPQVCQAVQRLQCSTRSRPSSPIWIVCPRSAPYRY